MSKNYDMTLIEILTERTEYRTAALKFMLTELPALPWYINERRKRGTLLNIHDIKFLNDLLPTERGYTIFRNNESLNSAR